MICSNGTDDGCMMALTFGIAYIALVLYFAASFSIVAFLYGVAQFRKKTSHEKALFLLNSIRCLHLIQLGILLTGIATGEAVIIPICIGVVFAITVIVHIVVLYLDSSVFNTENLFSWN